MQLICLNSETEHTKKQLKGPTWQKCYYCANFVELIPMLYASRPTLWKREEFLLQYHYRTIFLGENICLSTIIYFIWWDLDFQVDFSVTKCYGSIWAAGLTISQKKNPSWTSGRKCRVPRKTIFLPFFRNFNLQQHRLVCRTTRPQRDKLVKRDVSTSVLVDTLFLCVGFCIMHRRMTNVSQNTHSFFFPTIHQDMPKLSLKLVFDQVALFCITTHLVRFKHVAADFSLASSIGRIRVIRWAGHWTATSHHNNDVPDVCYVGNGA